VANFAEASIAIWHCPAFNQKPAPKQPLKQHLPLRPAVWAHYRRNSGSLLINPSRRCRLFLY